MADTKEDIPGLTPGIGVLIDPDRLLGNTIEQNAPYFITVKGLRIYGRNPPNVIDNAIKLNSSETKSRTYSMKQAQTAIGVNTPSFMSKVKGALSTAGTTLKKGAVAAGTAIKKGAAVAGTAVKKGAAVAGTAVKKGAVAAGTAVKKGAVAAGTAVKGLTAKKPVTPPPDPAPTVTAGGGTRKKRKPSKRARVFSKRRH